MQESPIFTKTYDFLLWISQHVGRFPKSERFRLAQRIEDSAYGFYDQILMAARHPEQRLAWLGAADDELARLRIYLRLAKDHGFSSMRQYQHASSRVVEIGKLLGGWIKTVT
jgi:four helix bundle protein